MQEEPTCLGAIRLLRPMPTATEACAPRAGAQQQEAQALHLDGSPCSPSAEKACMANGDPVHKKQTDQINK